MCVYARICMYVYARICVRKRMEVSPSTTSTFVVEIVILLLEITAILIIKLSF